MAEKQFVSKRGLRSTKTRLMRSAIAIATFIAVIGSSLFKTLLGDTPTVVVKSVVAAALIAVFVAVRPDRFKWHRVPAPVVLYMLFSLIATAWVAAPFEHLQEFSRQLLIAVMAILVAYLITWAETLRTMASALRYLLIFALAVWAYQTFALKTDPTVDLSLVAILGIVIFGVQVWAGLQRPAAGTAWMLLSFLALALSKSSIAFMALAVVLVSLVFVLWARRSPQDHRVLMYVIGVTLLALTLFTVFWLREMIAPALGISLETVQTENVWTQVYDRLGAAGLGFFILVVFVTTWRVWFRAVDQPRRGAGDPLAYATSAIWPFLATTSLLVFSVVAATLVGDAGWFLLVLFAAKTRFEYIVPAAADEAKKLAWKNVPISAKTKFLLEVEAEVERVV